MKKMFFLLILNFLILYGIFAYLHNIHFNKNTKNHDYNSVEQSKYNQLSDIQSIEIKNINTNGNVTLRRGKYGEWSFITKDVTYAASRFAVENLLQKLTASKNKNNKENNNRCNAKMFEITIIHKKYDQVFFVNTDGSFFTPNNNEYFGELDDVFHLLQNGYMEFVNNKLFNTNFDVSEIYIKLYSPELEYTIIRKGDEYFLEDVDSIQINKKIVTKILTDIDNIEFHNFIKEDKQALTTAKYADIAIYDSQTSTKINIVDHNNSLIGIIGKSNIAVTLVKENIIKFVEDVYKIVRTNIFTENQLDTIEIKNYKINQEYFLQKLEGSLDWKLISKTNNKLTNLKADLSKVNEMINIILNIKSENIVPSSKIDQDNANKLYDISLHGANNIFFSIFKSANKLFLQIANKTFAYEIDNKFDDLFNKGPNFFRDKNFITLPEVAQIKTLKISKIDDNDLAFINYADDFPGHMPWINELKPFAKTFSVERYIDKFSILQKHAKFENQDIVFDHEFQVEYSIESDNGVKINSYMIKFNMPKDENKSIYGCDELQITVFELNKDFAKNLIDALHKK